LALVKNDLKIKDKRIQLQIGRTFLEAGLISNTEYDKIKKLKQEKKLQSFQSNFGLMSSGHSNQYLNPTHSVHNLPSDVGMDNFSLNQNNEFNNLNYGENPLHDEEENTNTNKKK